MTTEYPTKLPEPGGGGGVMDGMSMLLGILIGAVFGTVLGWSLRGDGSSANTGQPSKIFRPLRISKNNLTCYDCGTQMTERYPGSVGARRYCACPACGRFDSYIDTDRVDEYQRRHPS